MQILLNTTIFAKKNSFELRKLEIRLNLQKKKKKMQMCNSTSNIDRGKWGIEETEKVDYL